jgi:hypothetical protein
MNHYLVGRRVQIKEGKLMSEDHAWREAEVLVAGAHVCPVSGQLKYTVILPEVGDVLEVYADAIKVLFGNDVPQGA